VLVSRHREYGWTYGSSVPSRPVPAELTAFLAPFPDELAETVLALRRRVLRVLPRYHEVIWDAANGVTVMFTPTTRWQDSFCNIATYTKHANLVFKQGTSLADPVRVLTGTGKDTLHASFRAVSETKAPWIEDYVRAAAALAGASTTAGDGGRSIRGTSATKRRPGTVIR